MAKKNNESSMLIVTVVHPQKWVELWNRWEFDAINAIERIFHTLDNIIVTNCKENLLGKIARGMLNSWKFKFPIEYLYMTEIFIV